MESNPFNPEMIVILAPGLPATRRRRIRERLESVGATVSVVDGAERQYLELRGEIAALQTIAIDGWPGVDKVIVLGESAMHWAPDDEADCAPIQVAGQTIGQGEFTIIAGPCAIEDEERALRIAGRVEAAGANLFRGGAYKPRTSPYAFQGLGKDALPILEKVRNQTGLGIITEVLDPRDVERISQVADMLQVGSRNMHNYSLLKELGQASTPVLLKRGFSSTIDEWLMAAEYILSGGNSMVVLCERGIRCAAASRKVVLDLGAISELKKRTHLPIFVDPSHGSGEAYRVPSLAKAAVAAGADGVLIEVHDQPSEALSDGRQALTPEQFEKLVPELYSIRTALGETGTQFSEQVVGSSSGEDH
ncbi:MAG: 3-deoxy-7-phosphoheptulonate synthase [Planctomycetota bacterium]|nr:3-deoxy-7-phosphoheptulonate synthase [Planctomycetota bacterium]